MQDQSREGFAAGDLFARKYRIERVLGEGGMGVVLAARHEALDQRVAIKLLRSEALRHTGIQGRFLREARAAVSLRSEHVARVIDVGNLDDGRPFIVMEHLEGQDLSAIIAQGPLAVGVAVDYVMQACEAIAEAHAAGIIHRDLKPSNLFLTRRVDGRPLVKVLDFGISKSGTADLQLTRTTEILGSPSYMSPEQLRSSRDVDARSDIWSLGIILFELLAGRLPYECETLTQLVLVVVNDPPPPIRTVRPEVPAELEALILRCMEKTPDKRFASVADLVQALEPFAAAVTGSTADRVRAVAKAPAAAQSGPGASAAVPSPVAWGQTESQVHAATVQASRPPGAPRPSGSRRTIRIATASAAVAFIVVVGLVVSLSLRSRDHGVAASPPAAPAASESMPLADGPKDLPPLPAIAAASAAPAPAAESSSSTAAATALHSAVAAPARRPPTSPSASAPPRASSARPPVDELSNIGRR